MEKFFQKLSKYHTFIVEGLHFLANKPPHLKLRGRYVRVLMLDKKIEIHADLLNKQSERWIPVFIVIDMAKKRIDYTESSPQLFSYDYHGTHSLATVILSVPTMILCIPFILMVRTYYWLIEIITGMSRYSYNIFTKVESWLDEDTKQALHTAMENSWKLQKYLSRPISFKKAQVFLSKHHLKKIHFIASYVDYEELHYYWYDEDGNRVAQISHEYEEDFAISVLGSVFINKKAKKLLNYYKTKEEKTVTEY